ncbi:hypothetical protein [Pseudochrobactrum sp. HB0163]|uniref:hypothetical protein n=1 Tax=Pseudochrobactrum sp. HB0163 TaxID=3450708 RepID=UPI003F6DABB7
MPALFHNTARFLAQIAASAKRLPQRTGSLLLACLLGSGLSAGAFAASFLPAQAPLTKPGLKISAAESLAEAQPMPPLPDQAYNPQLHDGLADLNNPENIAGIDPFITGPVPR